MVILIAFALVGVAVVSLIIVESLWSVLQLLTSFLMPYFQPAEVQTLQKRFGPWAAITGSTDGIGKQYALELASRGLSIVLISRNPQKLKDTAAEIERTHNVKTKIIVADFSEGAKIYPHIEDELKDIPLGILVNNVGLNYEYPMRVSDLPSPRAWELINVNVGAVTMMSKLVLPGMVARGRGAIVNISSGSELKPWPLMAIYGATKAYNRSFTLALREEYSSRNIYVQHVSPMFVSTKINSFSQRIMDGNVLVPDVVTYVRHLVATLGRVTNTTGYWIHGVQYTFARLAPMWLGTKVSHLLSKQFLKEQIHDHTDVTNKVH